MEGVLEELDGITTVIIDPKEHKQADIYKLMIGAIVPRPIAFVSTVSPAGVLNLAPFSFFNGVASNPPTVLFCPVVRKDGKEKDTLVNVEATGVFTVNIVAEPIAVQMNLCSGDYPPEVDEFALSGLTPVPGTLVASPRVKESPAAMECKLREIVRIGDGSPGSGAVVIGEILLFHFVDGLVTDFRVDQEKLRAIGRMGGPSYTRTTDRFDLVRPKTGELRN